MVFEAFCKNIEKMSIGKKYFVNWGIFTTFAIRLQYGHTMRNKHILFTLCFFCMLHSWCNAQYLRINHLGSRTDFSFDLNTLYNYNVYERNRWGGGLYLQTPLRYDQRYGSDFQNSLSANAYLAWGTGDHAWKYGADVALLFPRNITRRILLGYHHDIEQAGRHSFSSYNIFNTIENSSYFSSRYSSVSRLSAGVDLDINGPGFLSFTLRLSREQLLFSAQRLLFPQIDDDDALPYSIYHEALTHLRWGDHWHWELLCGLAHHDISNAPHYYAHLVAQYSNTFKLRDKYGSVRLFAQGGTTLGRNTPISRRFSLGGTGGSLYYFSNSLLTVHPNLLMADSYLHLALRYTAGRPLWQNALSRPTPFLQVNALWGAMHTFKGWAEQGTYLLLSGENINTELQDPSPGTELISFVAPFKGVLEPAAGIDQLVHWGIVDFGVAVALQLTPENSLYHSDNFFDRFSVMCVAKVVFDK